MSQKKHISLLRKSLASFLLTMLLIVALGASATATTYFGKPGTAPNLVASWGTNSGGGGTAPTNFTTAGDVFVIENGTTMTATAAWLIGAAGTTASTLQINNGGTLAMSTFLLTLASCDFINSGSFTSTTGGVTISGTLGTNTVAGFTTTGSLSCIKTGGAATISGNVTAVNLTVNGANGTLVLGGSNTFSGTRTLTAGTLSLASVSALGAAGTAVALNGGTLDLMTDASVNAYNVTVGGAAAISSDRATSGAGITHTLGTLSIGNFQLSVTVGTNVSSGTAGLTFGTTTLTANTPLFDVATGANLTLGAVGGAFAMTKQGGGQMTLATNSTRATAAGSTTLTAGTLRLNIANALNTLATAPLSVNGGTLSLGVTAGATYGGTATTVGGAATVESDRLTGGAGVPQILATLSIGSFTLNINAGSNVTSGIAGVTFGAVTFTGAPTFTVNDPAAATTRLSVAAVSPGGNTATINGNGDVIQTGVWGPTAGGIIYSGTGTLTLSQANTFTGGVTIMQGTVIANVSNVGTTSGAAGPSTSPITLGSSAGGSASLLANTFTVSNAVNLGTSAAGTLTIGNNGTTTAPIFSGAIGLNGNNLTVSRTGTTGTMTMSGGITGVGNVTINNSGTTSTIAVSTASFNNTGTITNTGSSTGTVTISGGVGANVTSITESSTTSALTISTTALTVNSGGTTLTNSSSGAVLLTVSGGTTGTGNLTLNNNTTTANGITLSTTAVNHTGTITNSGTGSGTTLISAVIGTNITGVVQNSATSTLSFTAANTYTSGLTIKAGTVTGTVANSFGPGGNVITIGDASGSANATLSGAGAVTFPPSISVASGNSGVATITSSAACTFSGAVTLNSHDLILSPAASALTLSGGVTGSGNLTLNSTGAGIITLSTTSVNNTGTITNSGAGGAANVISAVIGTNVTGVTESSSSSSLTLSGANTYAGETTLSSGTLNINSATAIGSGTFTITSGTINNTSGGAITLTNNNVQNWNGDFVFTGTRSLNLGTGAVTPNASRQVTVSANTLTVGGVIGGAITLTKAGAGTLTLSGANTFTGGVTLNSGTLNINNASALGDVTGTFTINGGTIDNTTAGTITTVDYPLSLNADLTYSGSLARILNLGTGAVAINADRQITVSAGTLTIGGTISASSINLTKAGTGTLSFGANAVTLNGLTISAGTLTSTSGTLSLAGDFSNNGTFTHNSGTVTLDGVAQAIGGSSISTCNNLTLGGTGAKAANIGINIVGALTVNQPLTMSGSNVLTMQSTASQPTFGSALTEITGSMTWQAISASAYTFNNAQTIVTFSGADAGRTFTLASQPNTYPTFGTFLAGHTVKRDFNLSYANWSTGTVTLQLAYLQAEGSTLGVTENKLKDFDGDITLANKVHGAPTRTASTGSTFGFLSYAGLTSATLAANELALDDRFDQFSSIAAAAWNVNSTWDAGTIPTSSDDVVIDNSFPVTIPNGYAAAAKSVTINATSTGLTVGGGTSGSLTIGTGGLTNNSAGTGLTVSAGASVTITGGDLTNSGSITNNGTITVQ